VPQLNKRWLNGVNISQDKLIFADQGKVFKKLSFLIWVNLFIP